MKRFAALALLAALVGSSLAGCIFVPPHDHDHDHSYHGHDHDHDGRY